MNKANTTPTLDFRPSAEGFTRDAAERRVLMTALQEEILFGREDLLVLGACDIAELMDDYAVPLSPTRVRRQMGYWVVRRPDLVTEVEGRSAWIIRLAGLGDLPGEVG